MTQDEKIAVVIHSLETAVLLLSCPPAKGGVRLALNFVRNANASLQSIENILAGNPEPKKGD